MAKAKTKKSLLPVIQNDSSNTDYQTLIEVTRHYKEWTEDNSKRMGRKNGWNDITDAYWGKLPIDWPYLHKVIDPRIRTSVIEKDARLLNQKLRGRLVPREGGDVLKARLNNALLDYQWDTANYGGTMLEKWQMMSQDTRLYGSKFALVKWIYEKEDGEDAEILFDGNEMTPLDLRDCGMDMTADHIRGAKWFQHREWAKIDDLDRINDVSGDEKMYKNLDKLRELMANDQDRRDNAYTNRILNNKGLTDRVGTDKSFPVAEIVTEYRKDKWIKFSPKHNIIVAEHDNPYEHHRIPVIQLRYYSIQGDPIGESEVEPVITLWKAIQSTLCAYLDNQALHMRPPLKIVEGKVRIETIVYGPEAQWLMDELDAVQELRGSGEAMQYFQNTYQALVSAFNTAMGDISQGVSSVDPNSKKKTATEIKFSSRQQNTRDQKNQLSLSEAIQDMMSMWLANNKQFLFSDKKKKEYILRIVGTDLFNYFTRAGLDGMDVPNESMTAISDIIAQQGGNVNDDDIQAMFEAGKMPTHPIYTNPNEKDPAKMMAKPKMTVNDMGDGAEISLVPEDLEGTYDYVPDVKSMSAGASDELMQSRQAAFDTMTQPNVAQMLQMQGEVPNIKELLITMFQDAGLSDADRYFQSQAQQPQQPQAGGPPMPGQPQQGQAMTPQQGPPQPDLNQILAQGDQTVQQMRPSGIMGA